MFNLLPDILKKKVKSEYRVHFLLVLFVAILFVQFVFLLLLFPSWLVSSYKEKTAISEVNVKAKPSVSNTTDSVSSVITSINTWTQVLNSTLKYPEVTPLFKSVLSKRGGEIRIVKLSYTRQSEKNASVTVQGVSSTRDSLLSFVKKLEQIESFKTVDLPVSNFTKDRNIHFTLNITVAP